jgi:hypothetical protein
MIAYDGVRREAERRRMLERRYVEIRALVKSDFVSYESLQEATGVDFKKSDDLARSLGCPDSELVSALFV